MYLQNDEIPSEIRREDCMFTLTPGEKVL